MAFDVLRRRHFPPERNHIAAHLTLFHHLPGEELTRIHADCEAVAAATPELTVTVTGPMLLGRGVALRIEGAGLVALRAGLAARWAPWLTPQDAQGFRPHVTVQNKVDPATARALHDAMARGFAPHPVTVTGLSLWRYRGGPWSAEGTVPLTGGSRSAG